MNDSLEPTADRISSPASTAGRALARLLKGATSFVGTYGPAGLLVVSVALATVVVRVLTLEPIEIGGDALAKWEFVRQWSHTNDFSQMKWTHHMARLGINVPLYVVQRLFGTAPNVYYALPVAAATVQSVFSFLVARRLAGNLAGVVAVLLLLEFDPMERAGSQLVPGVFSGAYLMIALYCALCASDSTETRKRRAWVVGAAAACFAGWLTKESNLFFVPGVAWILYYKTRDWRDLLWFAGALAAGFLLETLFFTLGTAHHYSRFDLVANSHGGWSGKSGAGSRELGGKLRSFWDLLRRFEMTGPSWRATLAAFAVAGLGIVAFARDRRALGVAIAAGSYLFLTTFLLKGLNPLRVWIGFNERYFDDAAAAFMVAIGCFGGLCVRSLLGRSQRLKGWLRHITPYSFIFCVGAIAYYGYLQYEDEASRLRSHPLRTLPLAAEVVQDAFERQLPIVTRNPTRQRKPLWLAYAVLLDEKQVVQGDGTLPSYREFIGKAGSVGFLHKDPTVSGAAVRRYMKEGCAVQLEQRARFIKTWPRKKLPARCAPLTKEAS